MGFITDALAPKNKFQAQQAKLDQSQYGNTINQAQAGALNQGNYQTGFGAQQGVLAAQQGLQGQLGDIAAGKGPNPAQQMLKQQTSQNINTAAGQAASARGINPALAARMAVDSAAGANQQAAGQGATLQAQQSLGALGQQVGNAAAMGQTAQGLTNAGLGQQAIQNQILANAGGLQNQQNNANIANTLGTNQINAGVASQNAANSAQMLGGLMNAAGGAATLFASKGGVVPPMRKLADGGPVEPLAAPGGVSPVHAYLDSLSQVSGPPAASQGVQSFAGGGMAQPNSFQMPTLAPAGGLQAPASMGGLAPSTMMPTAPQLGSAPLGIEGQAPVVPGGPTALQAPAWASESPSVEEADRSKQEAAAAKMGSAFSGLQEGGLGAYDRFAKMSFPGMHLSGGGPIPFLGGGNVPGHAPVPGNSEANDIVPALLSPGEVVIPRDLAQSPDAPAQAAAFVAHLMRGKGKGYGKVLKARGAGRRGKR